MAVVQVGLHVHVGHQVLAGSSVHAVHTLVQGVVGTVVHGVVQCVQVHVLGVLGHEVGTLTHGVHASVHGLRGVVGSHGEVLDLVGGLVQGATGTAGNDRAGHRHQGSGTEAAHHGGDGLGHSRGGVLGHLGSRVGKGRGVLPQLNRGVGQLLAHRVQGVGHRLRGLDRVLQALAGRVDRSGAGGHVEGRSGVLLVRITETKKPVHLSYISY